MTTSSNLFEQTIKKGSANSLQNLIENQQINTIWGTNRNSCCNYKQLTFSSKEDNTDFIAPVIN